jgi:hypothetical protein
MASGVAALLGPEPCPAAFDAASSLATSTINELSSRKVCTCGMPASTKVTVALSTSVSASIELTPAGRLAIASARSQRIC